MTSIDELDELLDWNQGASVLDDDAHLDQLNLLWSTPNQHDFSFPDLDNVAPDDSLFVADGDGIGSIDLPMDATPALDLLEHTDSPCLHCSLGGYSCKKIREGSHKGYCTSCVALGAECSFAGAALDPAQLSDLPPLSANPWDVVDEFTAAVFHPNLLSETLQTDANVASSGPSASNPADDAPVILAPRPIPPPKVGARFSRESVRILKNWLSSHNRHPYPSDEEKEALQRQTGLNKTQISNWLANARRRGKVQPPRSTSPHVGNWPGSIDIPKRRGTPALEAMNPLQRWEHSPPEHEAASVTAIARAVTASSAEASAFSSGLNSPYSFNYTDDGSSRSLCNQSSTSSLGTSLSSNGSRSSAYSHGSRKSWGSFGSAPFSSRGHRRRRRRGAPQNPGQAATNLTAPLKTFQCTFCTDTFRTKHDWQRHEKSLHLSLERWVCAPVGPRAVNPETGQLSCVYCGLADPDDNHLESHNHSACQERAPEERTFYRKDHLNQHLRLVHNGKFVDWSMKQWKEAAAQIRSRCGFCGIIMDSWTNRVDHLAEHFKTGCSMADWKGDWGFDMPVLDMVENSIPPYLIHHERVSPLPYSATAKSPPESPRNAYELIKMELAYFGANYWEQHHRAPTDEEMQLEGCRIIFASELLSLQGIATQKSWFRDLIMSSRKMAQKARFGPLRGAAESRLATLKINGKDNLFEECPMEIQLHKFVKAKQLLGLTAMDDELQEEACKIVGRVEEVCTHPSESVANLLLRLITGSTDWLADFRRRAHLPRSEDVQDRAIRSTDPKSIDSTIHSYSRLERELTDFLRLRRSEGVEPTDEDLQRQARIIIFEFDDGWNQTAADNIHWLEAFKQRHPPEKSSQSASPGRNDFSDLLRPRLNNRAQPMTAFLSNANCYSRLAKELRRWARSTMSPNNPKSHVPTDEELQYQARWILYDDDDPWNQTAADNAEWLEQFKRDVGINKEPGDVPERPSGHDWALEQIATGGLLEADEGGLASVFCSRRLERGLAELVERSVRDGGRFPSDEAIRAEARDITKSSVTAADDVVLLEKFKAWMRKKLPQALPAADMNTYTYTDAPSLLTTSMEFAISDEDLGNMLQDMEFSLDTT
ncbi:hypothetical protein CDD83_6967 [Cordyceps sp. RAO-2017]|nr:hypothetical protein CDD83_6967 [Cordyceps sp. RAO-2017]